MVIIFTKFLINTVRDAKEIVAIFKNTKKEVLLSICSKRE